MTVDATASGFDADTGEIVEGYTFAKPILISMLYAVGDILDGKSAPEDWQPELTLWDTATSSWKNAKDTCPPEQQFEETIHAERRYSVDVCHLTQFALWFQRRPWPDIGAIEPPLPTIVTNSSEVLLRLTAGDKAAWDGARLRLQWEYLRNRGPDNGQLRVTAIELEGTYTSSGPQLLPATGELTSVIFDSSSFSALLFFFVSFRPLEMKCLKIPKIFIAFHFNLLKEHLFI